MANPTGGNGFQPTRHFLNAAGNFQNNTRTIAYDYATAIGFGDVVVPLSDGTIGRATASDTPIEGIFLGCLYTNPSAPQGSQVTYQKNWPGVSLGNSSIVVTAFICNDPYQVFTVRASSTAITTASIGANATFVANAVSASGISTETLNSASVATTTTLPFRIVGLSKFVNNDNSLANNLVEVVMNSTNAAIQNAAGV